MWRRAGAVIATIWLGSCGSAAESECPPLIVYPPEYSHQLADELIHVRPDGTMVQAVTEYFVTRRQLEACQQSAIGVVDR